MNKMIDIVHDTIYQFFGDGDEEEPLTEKQRLLLTVNKAICKNLRAIELCEDVISREYTITALRADPSFICAGDQLNAIRIIEGMPPVTPLQKTGHWITKRTIMHDGEFYCDVCDNDAPFNKTFHYCPNCGAKMVESQESEVTYADSH